MRKNNGNNNRNKRRGKEKVKYKLTMVRYVFFIINRLFINIVRLSIKKKNMALCIRKSGLLIAVINILTKAFTYTSIHKALKYLIKKSI